MLCIWITFHNEEISSTVLGCPNQPVFQSSQRMIRSFPSCRFGVVVNVKFTPISAVWSLQDLIHIVFMQILLMFIYHLFSYCSMLTFLPILEVDLLLDKWSLLHHLSLPNWQIPQYQKRCRFCWLWKGQCRAQWPKKRAAFKLTCKASGRSAMARLALG